MSSLTFDSIIKFKNSKEFIELDRYYKNIRTLDLFNYYGQENPHTNFLSNLFKIDNPYTNDDKPFKLLLGLLSINAEKQDIKNYEIFRDIYLNFSKVDNLKVSSQQVLSQNRIPDITIGFTVNKQRYIILLEGKVTAEENVYPNGKFQTSWYRELAEAKYDDYKRYYVFLSNEEDPKIHDYKNWIKVSYQNLLDYVLAPCAVESSNVDVPLTINEYINSYSNSYNKEDKGVMKLAITPKEKELVELIWNKNKEILKVIIDLMLSDKNYEKLLGKFCFDNSKILSSIFNVLNYISKEYVSDKELAILKSKIPICYFDSQPYYTIIDFIYTVLKDILNNQAINSFDNIPSSIKGLDYSCPRLFLAKKDIPESSLKYFSESRIKKYPLIIPNSNQELLYATSYNADELLWFINDITNDYEEYKARIKLPS